MKYIWMGRTMARVTPLCVGAMILTTGMLRAAMWQTEIVDESGIGRFSSLKIDNEGNAHLAYVAEDGKNSLKYAFWDHGLNRWFVMTVAQGASFSSLALDSKQRPHISYADAGTVPGCKLRYVYWNGTSWNNQAVPLNAETIAYYTSIVLDADDNPSISFYEYDGPRGSDFRVRMRVVTRAAKEWHVRTVDGQNQSGKFNALAVDAEGHMHLGYANVNAGTASVRYGYWDGNSWNLDEVEGLDQDKLFYVGYSVCIALDKEGNPHLSYMNYSSPAVKYAVRKDGHWQIEVVDRLAKIAYPDRNSIIVNDDGVPYIGYFDAGTGSLKVAHREGQKWVAEVVDTNGSGFASSLQIDRGTIWISYADEANGGIRVARATLAEVRGGPVSKLPENEGSDAAQPR